MSKAVQGVMRVVYRAGGCDVDDILGAAGLAAGGRAAAHPGTIWCARGHPLRIYSSSPSSASGVVQQYPRL